MTKARDIFPGQLKLPSLPAHISSSQRSWDTCRRYWALSSVLKLKPKDAKASVNTTFGSLLHTVLETWYSSRLNDRGQDYLLGLLGASLQSTEWPEWMHVEIDDAAAETLRRFYKKYGNDGIEVTNTELKLDIELKGSNRPYVGYIDLVYTLGDTTYIEDIKTSRTSIDPMRYTLFNPALDDYIWAFQKTAGNEKRDVVGSYLFLTPDSARRVVVPRHELSDRGVELAQLASEQATLPLRPRYTWRCGDCGCSSLCAAHLTGRDPRDIIATDFTTAEQREGEE